MECGDVDGVVVVVDDDDDEHFVEEQKIVTKFFANVGSRCLDGVREFWRVQTDVRLFPTEPLRFNRLSVTHYCSRRLILILKSCCVNRCCLQANPQAGFGWKFLHHISLHGKYAVMLTVRSAFDTNNQTLVTYFTFQIYLDKHSLACFCVWLS
mgnify:FL=1